MTEALLPPGELAELRAIAAATFVHRATVYEPTRTRGPAAKTVDTYAVTASDVPCRVRPAVALPLERIVAGAVAAPDAYDVRFAPGTTLSATAVLKVTGDAGGIPFTLWLRVQGGPQVRAVEVARVVRGVKADAVVAAVVPTGTTVTLSASSVAEDGTPPTLTAAVLPAGAPQDGAWSSANAAAATVDPTTGAVTLMGPGAATFTFTPTGHPEAAGSATLTVTAALNPANPDDLVALLTAAAADPVTGRFVVDHAWVAGRGHPAGAGVKAAWVSYYDRPGLAPVTAEARADGALPGGLYYDPTAGALGRLRYRDAANAALSGLVIQAHPDLAYDQGRAVVTVSRVVRGDVVYGRVWCSATGTDVVKDDFGGAGYFDHAADHARTDSSQRSGLQYAAGAGDTVVRVHQTVPGGPNVGMVLGMAGRDTLVHTFVAPGEALPAGSRIVFVGPHNGYDAGANTMSGDELLMLTGSGTLTRAQWDAIDDFCRAHGGRVEDARPQAIVTGNSLVNLFVQSTFRADMTAAGWDTANLGATGMGYDAADGTRASLKARFPWAEALMRNPRRAVQIVAPYEYVNTSFGAVTAPQIYDAHKKYAQRCKDAGFTVMGITPLPWTLNADTSGAMAQAIRTLMLADAAFWGGTTTIADIGNPATTGDPARLSNATYYFDGVHWTVTQQNACVPELKRALLAIAAG